MTSGWQFGVAPLPQALALAPLLRRLTASVLSLEHEEIEVEALIEHIRAAQRLLEERAPLNPAPRVGPDALSDQRVYIDHSRAIGAYNACFPEYTMQVDGDRAWGTVSFPLAYEGPPGIVHGGFLALFFDCAIQHHNCDLGTAGKTTALNLSYRRPTPLLQTVQFEIERSADDRRISSHSKVMLDGTLLCAATMEAVAGDRSRLPMVSPRRRA